MTKRRRWFGWKANLLASLEAGSKTADTSRGFVEYAVKGSGPAILVVHGTPGGYDQGLLSFRELPARGYALISPSRPGYLRTPIGGGFTPGEQADLLALFLDTIGVENVIVAAFSAGGPCACAFALKYARRTCGLLLLSAVTRDFVPEEHSMDSQLGKLFDYDLGSWLISLLAHYAPSLMVKAIVDAEGDFDPNSADRISEQILMEPEKVKYVGAVIDTMVPASRRRRGMENDLYQLSNLGEMELENVLAPALIIHGTNDKDVPSSHATYAASRIPNAELLMIEEGFHLLDLSVHADMIWDRMQDFLIKCGPNASRVLSGLVVLFVLSVALCPSAACAQKPQKSDILLNLNETFRATYNSAIQEDLSSSGPIIIVGGGKVVLQKSGIRLEAEYIPDQFRILKTIDHIPLAIFVKLVNHSDQRLSDEFIKSVAELRKAIAAAELQEKSFGLTPEALERARGSLATSTAFLDKVIAAGQVSRTELYSFARQSTAVLMDNAYDAVAMELGGLNDRVMAWKREMTPAEWDNLHVVVMGAHMSRQQERQMQYFQKLLGEREEGNRIVYLEGSTEEAVALDLLGKHLIDAAIGDAFFRDPSRMHRDLLSDAARRYLQDHDPNETKAPDRD